jgi:hypothetical protein
MDHRGGAAEACGRTGFPILDALKEAKEGVFGGKGRGAEESDYNVPRKLDRGLR